MSDIEIEEAIKVLPTSAVATFLPALIAMLVIMVPGHDLRYDAAAGLPDATTRGRRRAG